jgi:hypothetical protein
VQRPSSRCSGYGHLFDLAFLFISTAARRAIPLRLPNGSAIGARQRLINCFTHSGTPFDPIARASDATKYLIQIATRRVPLNRNAGFLPFSFKAVLYWGHSISPKSALQRAQQLGHIRNKGSGNEAITTRIRGAV